MSHESLRGGSAVIVVQNLKREGGRPESESESMDALVWEWRCVLVQGRRGELGGRVSKRVRGEEEGGRAAGAGGEGMVGRRRGFVEGFF